MWEKLTYPQAVVLAAFVLAAAIWLAFGDLGTTIGSELESIGRSLRRP